MKRAHWFGTCELSLSAKNQNDVYDDLDRDAFE